MVISQVRGRLGNILFSIACGEYFAIKNNDSFKLSVESDNIYYDNIKKYILKTYDIANNYDINNINNIYNESSPIGYNKLNNYSGNVKINGYRQSPLYFNNDTDFIYKTFIFSNEIINEANNLYTYNFNDLIAIHIRRGDFLLPKNNFFIIQEETYYISFINSFGKNQKFIFFSDDIDWCKLKFGNLNNCSFADKISKNVPTELIDLYLISICKEVLISNSTFSWWGAYLNKNINKKVYYSLPWMKIPFKCDIIPNDKRWIQLK